MLKWFLLICLALPLGAEPTELGEKQRQKLLFWCRENLEHQYTPGFKGTLCSYYSGMQPDLDMSAGRILLTQDPAHLAILGQGFFCLEGQVYTRDGRFLLKGETVVGQSGRALLAYPLDEQGNVKDALTAVKFGFDPATGLFRQRYTGFSFDSSGTLLGEITQVDPVTLQADVQYEPVYRIPLALFGQPQRLLRSDFNLFLASTESGAPRLELTGQKNAGFFVPRSLELSNVNVVEQTYLWGRLDASQPAPMKKPAKPTPRPAHQR